MMTGYLFWGKLLSRNGRLNWMALYISRIFRIGPLYVCAIAMMYLIVVFHTGFHIHDSLGQLIRETTNWLSLGISKSKPDVNGFHNTRVILNGVTWTLFWEWRFYGSLLFLALVARFRKADLPAVSIALGTVLSYLLLTRTSGMFLPVFATFYLFGMLAASLEKFGLLAPGHAIPKSIAAISLIVLFETTNKTAYAAVPAILLGCTFYLVVSGADLFGILTSRPARRLGEISLGIYLLQGLIMTAVFSLDLSRATALKSPGGHWLLIGICALFLVGASMLSKLYIERPGMRVGKALTRHLIAMAQQFQTVLLRKHSSLVAK